ncbi:hypothetical protein B0H11DRAFT_1939651 [Mycena galericulata]|nr:hypothetical protein B0H11DRAFT_1939651 [Mycena galericulata]
MFIPLDVCWEIAQHSSAHDVSSLLQLSTAHVEILRPVLYRNVHVYDAAHVLVHTLANSPAIASMVKTLTFNASLFTYVDEKDWATAIVLLNGLRHLTIAPHVPLDRSCIPRIAFRLQSLAVQGRMIEAWTALMHAQPDLKELHFLGDLTGLTPGIEALPSLRHVTGRVGGTFHPSLVSVSPASYVISNFLNPTTTALRYRMDPALRCLAQDLLLRELVDAIRAPPAGTSCDHCGASESTNRCWDCFWPELLCTACIAAGHAEQPLHRIEIWNGEKWVTGSLREIGVRIYLGHGRHGRCPRPIYNPRYAIVNTRGTHEVGICFCACDEAQDPNDQLRQQMGYKTRGLWIGRRSGHGARRSGSLSERHHHVAITIAEAYVTQESAAQRRWASDIKWDTRPGGLWIGRRSGHRTRQSGLLSERHHHVAITIAEAYVTQESSAKKLGVSHSLENPAAARLAHLHASSQENNKPAETQGISAGLRDVAERRTRRHHQSEVLARESEKRLRDYSERIEQEWNTRWEASFQDLTDWAKNWTEVDPPPVRQTNGEDVVRQMPAGRRRDVIDAPTDWDVLYWSMIRSLREMELRDGSAYVYGGGNAPIVAAR